MKILAVSDEPARRYYDYYQPGMLDEFDLILSCGDLSGRYLEFLVTMAHCPLLYVHGNHDDRLLEEPPQGCICIEDRIYEYQGVRFFGLGGSYRYRPDIRNMYTEKQMQNRIRRQWLTLRIKKGFDVLVTHAPALGCGDLSNNTHRGFQGFCDLMDRYQPVYMVHGHVHRNYAYDLPGEMTYRDTKIINAWQYQTFEV